MKNQHDIIANIIKNAQKEGSTKRATKEELHAAMMEAIWGEQTLTNVNKNI